MPVEDFIKEIRSGIQTLVEVEEEQQQNQQEEKEEGQTMENNYEVGQVYENESYLLKITSIDEEKNTLTYTLTKKSSEEREARIVPYDLFKRDMSIKGYYKLKEEKNESEVQQEKVDVTDPEWITEQLEKGNNINLTFISELDNTKYRINSISVTTTTTTTLENCEDPKKVDSKIYLDVGCSKFCKELKHGPVYTIEWWKELIEKQNLVQVNNVKKDVNKIRDEKLDFILSHHRSNNNSYFIFSGGEYTGGSKVVLKILGTFEIDDKLYIDFKYSFANDDKFLFYKLPKEDFLKLEFMIDDDVVVNTM